MARIPDNEPERLKNEVSVERLVEASGVELKKAGKDMLGRCPFHDDAEASLVVTAAKNLWHCFGCQVSGGPIDWVMKSRGVSFRHAVELLKADPSLAAGQAGEVKRTTVRSLPAPVAFDADDRALLNQTIDYYHRRLLATSEAAAYLKARGLTHPELIAAFKLGVADRTLGLRLPEKTRKAGADIRARLQKVGLIRESGHEHFNGSLVIPVFDEGGNVVEVYGRKILDYLRAGTPKHLYLPGPHAGVFNRAIRGRARIKCMACESASDSLLVGRRGAPAPYRPTSAACCSYGAVTPLTPMDACSPSASAMAPPARSRRSATRALARPRASPTPMAHHPLHLRPERPPVGGHRPAGARSRHALHP